MGNSASTTTLHEQAEVEKSTDEAAPILPSIDQGPAQTTDVTRLTQRQKLFVELAQIGYLMQPSLTRQKVLAVLAGELEENDTKWLVGGGCYDEDGLRFAQAISPQDLPSTIHETVQRHTNDEAEANVVSPEQDAAKLASRNAKRARKKERRRLKREAGKRALEMLNAAVD